MKLREAYAMIIPVTLFVVRELTQDPLTLTDDKVLVQMGSQPKGLSTAEGDAYVTGLKQVISEIRSRKVKNFDTVASEITAYRSQFLGDKSKVLNM
ncbi:hypothetical protein MMC12_006082 [Toensbergia leucococca]|nr:hypothetical protein [Toensbergia leucococca]